jgi:hypothetical protein
MPGNPLPAGVKALSAYGVWAGPDVTDPHNELDVWAVGDDGKIYRWFFWVGHPPGAPDWGGPEVFG